MSRKILSLRENIFQFKSSPLQEDEQEIIILNENLMDSSEKSNVFSDRRGLMIKELEAQNNEGGKHETQRDDSHYSYISTEYSHSFWDSLHSYMPKELDIEDFQNFLFSPLQNDKTLFCKIIRKVDSVYEKLYPRYYLYLSNNEKFLLSAKKAFASTSITYLISNKEGVINMKDDSYIGKISSNFIGTEFNIFDNGKKHNETKNITEMRTQYGAVTYVRNKIVI
jgi:hypothetical protein